MSWFSKLSIRARRKAFLISKIDSHIREYFSCNIRLKDGRSKARLCLDCIDEYERKLEKIAKNGKTETT